MRSPCPKAQAEPEVELMRASRRPMPEVMAALFRGLKHWCVLWHLPRLCGQLRIEFNGRMNRSLGRCHVPRRLIRLNGVLLLPENGDLLTETLCHEAAHVAAHQLHGRHIKPHGPEWRALVKAAGFVPRATLAAHQVAGLKLQTRGPKALFEYHCPVCQVSSHARVKNSRYRCRACLKAGREGLLRVSRV